MHTDCMHTILHWCSPQHTHIWRHFTWNKMSPWTSDELLAAPPEQSFVTKCVLFHHRACQAVTACERERSTERQACTVLYCTVRTVKVLRGGGALRYVLCTSAHTEDEMRGTCGTHGDKKNAYSILMRKSEGNTPLGTPKVRWENNIKMDFE